MHSKKASFVRGTYYHYCFNESSLIHSYIPNRFEKAKTLKNKLLELAIKYEQINFFYKEIMTIFIGEVRQSIRQEIDYTKQIKNKIKNIRMIVNDPEVRIA